METRRWINQSQPQTLVMAVFLLYIGAAFALLFGLNNAPYGLAFDDLFHSNSTTDLLLLLTRALLIGGGAAAGYGIANERKSGYKLGVVVAAVPLAVLLYVCVRHQVNPLRFDVITLMVDVALFALLVHPQSREYERIWFK